MRTLIGLVCKDLLELLRDRLALALTVVLPALALVMFGYGIRMQSHDIPLTVFDYDRTADSRSFINALVASNVFQLKYPQGNQSATEALQHGYSALILPNGFAGNLEKGQTATANFFVDGTELNQARTTQLVCQSICESFHRRPTPTSYYVIPKIISWFNPGLHEELFIVPGTFAVLMWMFPSLLAAVAMARELERPAAVQAYVAKVSALNFIFSKLLVYLSVGLLQALLLFALGCTIFKLHMISCGPMFMVTTIVYIASAVLFGITLGATSRSQTVAVQGASSGGFFPCLLLSGFVYPLENIPPAIQVVSYLVPTRYYIHVVRDAFVQVSDWQSYSSVTGILLVFCAAFFAISWWALRKMQIQEVR